MASGRFSHPTRIGNWYEDSVHEELKMATFIEERDKGMLTSQVIIYQYNLHIYFLISYL